MTKQFYAYIHARPDGTPFYVGKGFGKRASNFSDRRAWHKNIVAKYGRENILVSAYPVSSEEFAFELEKGLIKTLRRMGHELCNLTDGGEGVSGSKHSEAAKIKIGLSSKARAKPISPEHRLKMSTARRGCKLSAATRQKMSVAATGRVRTPEHNAKLADARRGQKRSLEARARMSAAQLGKKAIHRQEASARKGSKVSPEVLAKRKATWDRKRELKRSIENV